MLRMYLKGRPFVMARRALFLACFLVTVIVFYRRTCLTVPRPEMVKSSRAVLTVPMSSENSRSGKAGPGTPEDKGAGRSKAEKVKLIILSYMRSGSSFTAGLFNEHPDVFYIYEPLHFFDYVFKKGRPLNFLDGKPAMRYDKKDPQQLDPLQKDTIRSILSCRLQRLGISAFENMKQPFARNRTKRIQDFLRCYKYGSLPKCLPKIQHACDTANVTMVKTLRFSMKQASALLENDPQVKVIHLVRDPRGVLNSREVTGVGRDYHVTAEALCAKVLQDVNDSKTLRTLYPGRILTVRYEDLTADPLNYTQKLLRFAGLDFSPQHRQFVWDSTSTGKKLSKYGDKRGDSKSTAKQWRLKIKVDFVRNADQKCSGLYEQMGYLRLSERHMLRNLSHPYYRDCKDVVAPLLCLH